MIGCCRSWDYGSHGRWQPFFIYGGDFLFERFYAKFRRFLSAALAIPVVMVWLPSSILHVSAVSPAEATIAAALVSFVGASGTRLWREGVGSDGDDAVNQMISDLKTLWNDFRSGFGGTVPTWESIAGVTPSNGKYILTYDTAQTFQGFSDWLAQHYDLRPGDTKSLLEGSGSDSSLQFYLPDDELEGLPLLEGGFWAMPVGLSGWTVRVLNTNGNVRDEYVFSGPGVVIGVNTDDNVPSGTPKRMVYFASLVDTATLTRNGGTPSAVDDPFEVPNVSRPNTVYGGFKFYYRLLNPSLSLEMEGVYFNDYHFLSGTSSSTSVLREMCYVALAGDPVGSGTDLFATVGRHIADLTYDLVKPLVDPDTGDVITPGQALVIDVGASASTSEDDLATIVADGYVAGSDEATIPFADAYPQPVAGAEELYPQASTAVDVDDLGLPDLGQALTTRFPFCIPWDVAALYKSLNATPARPVFTIDVVPTSIKSRVGVTGDTSVTLDLGDPRYDTLIMIIRWGCLGGFILGLAYATKRIVWTTGG